MKYLSKSPEPGKRRSFLSLISHSNSQKLWENILKLKEKKEQIRKNLSKLIIQLDQLTNARSTITFVLIFYLLGNSLHVNVKFRLFWQHFIIKFHIILPKKFKFVHYSFFIRKWRNFTHSHRR